MKHPVLAALLGLAAHAALGAGADPFGVAAALDESVAPPRVRVELTVPPHHIVYADSFKVAAAGASLQPEELAPAHEKLDKFSGEKKQVYDASARFLYRLAAAPTGVVALTVRYQGCDEEMCFFPQKRTFTLTPSSTAPAPTAAAPAGGGAGEAAAAAAPAAAAGWRELLDGFEAAGQASGYLGAPEFLAFLDRASGGAAPAPDELARFRSRGALVSVLLILLLGIGLNLTPCVLPLVPINLAIIGAGARAASRRQGFLLGGIYGLAMALVYGGLGLLVVLSGAKFGALNASPVFNAVIAVIFVALALAMFGAFELDFSRFQGRLDTAGRSRYAVAFTMGAVSALLAGACVAPVLISTLLLAGQLYAQGQTLALALPFVLGLGMGLPWPFAGAGLTFLPKPGKWMTWVKIGFGVFILGFALYYGRLAWTLHRQGSAAAAAGGGDPAVASTAALEDALRRAAREGRPVFLDFWATWCKNCHAMEATTFKDPAVARRLEEFVVVKYQAEFVDQAPARDVLDRFQAIGLPTYVILRPKAAR